METLMSPQTAATVAAAAVAAAGAADTMYLQH